MSWKLSELGNVYYKTTVRRMTDKEIDAVIIYLRRNKYPRPEDCPMAECSEFRPTCSVGICKIAVEMCGDF
jgi:hypothetical protein